MQWHRNTCICTCIGTCIGIGSDIETCVDIEIFSTIIVRIIEFIARYWNMQQRLMLWWWRRLWQNW